MTDWARKRAEDFHRESCDCPDKSGRKKHGRGAYRRFYCVGCLAAALDAAREEWRKRGEERGAQRERWECHRERRAVQVGSQMRSAPVGRCAGERRGRSERTCLRVHGVR